MHKKTLLSVVVFAFCSLIFALLLGSATTTNTVSTSSYYGRESVVKTVTFTVAPVAADDNSILTSVTSTEEVWGELKRIAISATGTDTAFKVILKDENGAALYTNNACSTASLPGNYHFVSVYNGELSAGNLTLDVNDVDPNNLTLLTVKVYYSDFRN